MLELRLGPWSVPVRNCFHQFLCTVTQLLPPMLDSEILVPCALERDATAHWTFRAVALHLAIHDATAHWSFRAVVSRRFVTHHLKKSNEQLRNA